MSVKPGELLALHAPTPPDAVKQRQGPGGRMLSYVDSRYVAQFLDDTVGPANWQRRSTIGPNGKVSCAIGIRVAQDDGVTEWVFKDDGADETDIEGAKGSFSDAFKRAAAISWGIARDLYGESSSGQRTSSPARPQQAPPAAPPAAGGGPAWPDDATIAAVDGGQCSVHHKAWRINSRGYYCSSKVADGWCKEQPPKAWIARQEVA